MAISQIVQIPVIDFEPFVTDDRAGQHQVAEAIYQACHGIGFIYLKNFGMSKDLIRRTFQQAKILFDLPFEEKQKLAWSDEFSNRGYIGVERERLDPNKPGDLKEAFNLGKEVELPLETDSDRLSDLNRMAARANCWPEGMPEFRQTLNEFFAACADTASLVHRAFAVAMQLPETYFSDRHQRQDYTLRLLHYPPIQTPPKPEQGRAGEHSDYGSVTLLFQDEVGGLEVQTTDGEWIAAPPIPDAIVVNTGDLMQRWTNHEFCSTKHRVQVPQDHRIQRDRYSIAFFCTPDYNAEITCVSSPRMGDRPALYPPILAGEYLLSRLRATY